VFKSDLVSTDASSGDAVHVADQTGHPVGTAFYSKLSQISLRFFDHRHVDPTPWYFNGRLNDALKTRVLNYPRLAADPGKCGNRLFFSESDGIPGLIVDRYGPVCVIQTLAPGAESLKGLAARWCMELPGVTAVVERNDPKVRELEGLPIVKSVLEGALPDVVEIEEGDLNLRVDVLEGQKTGAFLDQRDNRELVAAHSKGRVLDAFCYHGWFSMRAAKNARNVVAVDVSAEAVRQLGDNARRLGLSNIEPQEANVFDYLRECDLKGERFDTVILDPPAFAKNRGALEAAVRGYKEINLRALKILNPGGMLFTFSCSYHMTGELFNDTITDAARDSGRRVFVERRLGQALDHPVMMTFPESAYLKGLMLRVG
jgi:23S rRNA (cytosine1962-C5)-methyltransferase